MHFNVYVEFADSDRDFACFQTPYLPRIGEFIQLQPEESCVIQDSWKKVTGWLYQFKVISVTHVPPHAYVTVVVEYVDPPKLGS